MAEKQLSEMSTDEIININNYNAEIEEDITAISNKIRNLDTKLIQLEIKEQMINNIITRTNATLESIDANNFKWIGQTQANLMKQIESLGLIKDIIIKYEDMILKYRKMLNDIKERKMSNRFKIANLFKEQEESESDVTMVLEEVQKLLNGSSTINSTKNEDGSEGEPNDETNLFLDSIYEELAENGYDDAKQ